MVYRIAGGIGLILLGASAMGHALVNPFVIGVVLLIAGIALLAGL